MQKFGSYYGYERLCHPLGMRSKYDHALGMRNSLLYSWVMRIKSDHAVILRSRPNPALDILRSLLGYTLSLRNRMSSHG